MVLLHSSFVVAGVLVCHFFFFFSSRRRHTRLQGDWSSDVCSSDLHSYIETGRSLLEHGAIQDDAGKPAEGRVPGYPLVLAFIFATGIASPLRLTGAVLVQCLLGAWVVVLAARSSRALPGYLGVLPVGLLLAMEPSAMAYSNVILSEMLYSLVLLLALQAWERYLRLQEDRKSVV